MPQQAQPTVAVAVYVSADHAAPMHIHKGATRAQVLDDGQLIISAGSVVLAGHAPGHWSSYRIQRADDSRMND